MELLAEMEGKSYRAMTIQRPADFVSSFSEVAFPCLVWDHDGQFSATDRSTLAKALLGAGCRYAVCAGENSDEWHLAFDWEFVLEHLDDPDDVKDSAHVMTTSHEEDENDVAFFFVLCTNFDYHDFDSYLVLHIGSSPATERVNAAVREHALRR